MTEHERLLEEFEDAHFALLMEGVAKKEGERLLALNEMLQDNPEAAVPESVDKRCLETIDRHFAKERRWAGLRKTGRVLRLAAVIMAISVLLFTSVFALSEDFRVATLNLMLTVTERYTQFNIKSSDGDSAKTSSSSNPTSSGYFENAEIGWIPEGFLLNYDESFHDLLADCATFEDEHGEHFSVKIIPGDATMRFDTEDPESLEQVTINGKEGLCVVKYGQPGIMLADLENNLFIEISASRGISVDTVKKIAENIRILSDTPDLDGSAYFENAEIGWIPEGFVINYDESFHDLLADCARFEDEHGEYFSVTILPGTANLQFDTEDPESLEQVTINGKEGLCVVKYGEPGITLADLENNLFIMVDASSGVSVDTVKKIAENILIL